MWFFYPLVFPIKRGILEEKCTAQALHVRRGNFGNGSRIFTSDEMSFDKVTEIPRLKASLVVQHEW